VADAGVVHQDVERTYLAGDLGLQLKYLLALGHVDYLPHDLRSQRFKLTGGGLKPVFVDIDDDEVAALVGQEQAGLLADAACGAREEHPFPMKVLNHG